MSLFKRLGDAVASAGAAAASAAAVAAAPGDEGEGGGDADDDDPSLDVERRLALKTARLSRLERKFKELVTAYKNIVKERKNFQKIVQATSSFTDLADPDGLLVFYTNLVKTQEIARQEIARLTQAGSDAAAELASLRSAVDDKDAQIQKMKQDFALLGRQLNTKRAEEPASQALSVEMAELDALRTRVQTYEETNTVLEDKVKQMAVMIKKLTDNRASTKERVVLLLAQNQALQRKLEAATGESAAAADGSVPPADTDDFEALNTSAASVSQSDASARELEASKSALAAAERELASERAAADQRARQLEECQTQLQAASERVQELTDLTASLKQQHELALADADTRVKQAAAEAEAQARAEANTRVKQAYAEADARVKQHEQAEQELSQRLVSLQTQLSHAQAGHERVAELERQLQLEIEHAKHVATQLSQAEERLQQLEAANLATEQQLRADLSAAKAHGDATARELATAKQHAHEAEAARQALQDRVTGLDAELNVVQLLGREQKAQLTDQQQLLRVAAEARAVLESRLKESQMSDAEAVQSLSAERDALLQELQRTRTELNGAMQVLRVEHEQVLERERKLADEFQRTSERLQAAEAVAAQADAAAVELRQGEAASAAAVAAQLERITTLEADLTKRDERVSTVEVDLAKRGERVALLETDLTKRNERVATLEDDLQAVSARASQLEQQLQQARRKDDEQLSSLQAERQQALQRVQELEVELQQARAAVDNQTRAAEQRVKQIEAELQQARSAADERVKQLEVETETHRLRLSQLMTHDEALASNLREVSAQLAKSTAELDVARNAAAASEASLRLQINGLTQQLEAAAGQQGATAAALEEQLVQMRGERDQLCAETDQLRATGDQLRASMGVQTAALAAERDQLRTRLDGEISALSAELRQARLRAEQSTQQAGTALDALGSVQAQLSKVKSELDASDGRCEALQAEVTVKQRELDEYAQFCKELERHNQALVLESEAKEAELGRTRTAVQQLQDNVTYHRQESERKSQQMEDNMRVLATLEAALDEWRAKHDLQASQLTESVAQLSRQQQHFEELEVQLGQREDEVHRLAADLSKTEQSLRDKAAQAQTLQQETDEMRQSARTLEEDKLTLTALSERLGERVRHLEHTCGEQETLLAALPARSAALESVQSKCERLERDLQLCRDTLVQTDAQLRNTEDSLSMAQASGRDLTAVVEQLRQQLDRYAQVEEQLRAASAQLETVQQELSAKEEDWRIKESQLKALNKTLKEEVRKLGRSREGAGAGGPVIGASSSAVIGGLPIGTGAGDGVNLEYLKHCVLKYMEYDDQRTVPLIKVIGLILRFTPDELSRVQARVQARLNPLSALLPS